MAFVIKQSVSSFVKGIHNALVLYQKSQLISKIYSEFYGSYFDNIVQSLKNVWPLKKGVVSKEYSPWCVCDKDDSTRLCTALAIKSYFVLNDSFSSDEFTILKKLFYNNDFVVLNWDFFQKNSDNILFSKKLRFSNKIIFLNLQNIIFPIRQNANRDLFLFERFIDFAVHSSCGIIVFSRQHLFSERRNIANESFSLENLRDRVSNSHYISIEEVFLPNIFLNRFKDNEKFSVGAFDRLFELLSIGQDFIFSIENAYKK